ncbi:MAG: hypothetical protein E7632_05700 [Ruminococcaceae bacterium]|nr:hypothetical protein [Oscillospiraceae bacterium]
MRSEGNSSAKRDDISADELLKLLHISVENTAGKPRTPDKNKVQSESAARAASPRKDQFAIDDAVFKSAEQELKTTTESAPADDLDLDIDALIEKYISRPAPKPAPAEEAQAEEMSEETDAIVREFTTRGVVTEEPAVLPEEEPEAEPVLIPDSSDDLPEEIVPEEELAPVDELESMEEITPVEEIAPAVEFEPAEEVVPMEDDDDVKVFGEPTVMPVPVEAPAEELSAEKTAVFDISKVKELAGNAELDQLVDEAFDTSATEVFTPVSEAQLQDEPQAEQVYGTPGEEEMDQTDLDLMIAFGMNEELKDAVGEEKATELAENIQKKHEQTSQMQAVGNQMEFTSRDQADDILRAYHSKYKLLILRIILAVVLVGAVFFVENYFMFGITLPAFMRPTSYPVVYAMIDLQLVLLAGALVYRQIIDGIKGLAALKPVPESMTSFLLAMSALYTFAACLSAPVEGFRLFNLPVMFTVVLALIYEFMNLKRDVFSFNVISSKKKKFVVSPVSDTTESLEREMFRDYVPADAQIVRVGKTDFVDGFFARVSDNRISKPFVGVILPVVTILAALFVILTIIKTGSAHEAFTNAFLTITLTLPASSFIVYSLPFYKAAKDSYDNDSAIIGETSLHEYAGSAVISFEDKEVFPSGGVKVTSIKVYGSNRIDEIIYCLASAFIKVGGPLADVFSQATHDLGHSEDVELLEVEDDGFTVTIDDVQVYLGKASYMEKKDYDPPFDAEDKRLEQNTSVGILYVAYGGQLAAKVYVQYTIDSEFEGILAQLYKTGMCVGIKSFDPNIDDLMLAKKIKAMKYPVKVIRARNVEDIPHIFERCDSGIVSKRSVKALLRTVAVCERVSHTIKTNMIFKVLSMLIGVIAMVFIYSFGAEVELQSLWTLLYQAIWLIPVLIVTFFSV